MKTSRATVITAFLALAIMLPVVVRSEAGRASSTEGLLFLLAAIGLNIAVGYAGLPSLAQGAFAGIGAYGAAVLQVRAGWGPAASIAAAVAAATAAGWIVARAVARLRAPFVALCTWIAAWAFSIAVDSFPHLTGGSSGVVVAPLRLHLRALGVSFTIGDVAMYELAVGLVFLTLLAVHRCMRRYGPALHALREDPAAAAGAGVPVARFRAGALTASAAIAGVAGALGVHVAGVADPSSYAPLRSIELFVVVLIGGATTAGPLAGAAIVLALSRASDAIATATGHARTQIESIGTGVVLLVLVVSGLKPPRWFRHPAAPLPAEPAEELAPNGGAGILVRDATVAFGSLRALDRVTLEVAPGTCHAIIGPNGSGKTTLLRVIAGTLSGDVRIEPVGSVVARTFQRLAVAPDLTATEHVVAGMEPHRSVSFARTLLATPGAQAELARTDDDARRLLAVFGVEQMPDAQARTLTAGAQRFLQIARALAARPSVLLLDEPSAGLDAVEEQKLMEVVRTLRAGGLTIVLVEHNLALVRAVADHVTVLDAGVTIAEGTPAEVAGDAAVIAAYLG